MIHHPIIIGKQDGKLLYFHGDEHAIVYAPTGAGKSSSITIPNAFNWPGSLVVLDIKGECFAATSGYRSEVLGQDVYCFNPAAYDGRSHQWNPLSIIDRTSVDRFDQLSRQSFMLFPEAPAGATSSTDGFWIPSARMAAYAVALMLAETEGHAFNMTEVLRCFARGDSRDVLLDMIKRKRATGHRYSQIVVDGVNDYTSGSPDQYNGIRKMSSVKLEPWFNPRVQAATATSSFNLRQLRRRPMTIYVTIQPGDIPRYRALLALFFDAVIRLNTDTMPRNDPTLQYQTLVIADEFARIGRQDTLLEAAQYVRDYGFRMLYLIQTRSSLRSLYSEGAADDLFSNAGVEIVFGTKDHKLAKELSERIGDDTIDVVTQNRPHFFPSLNPSKQSDATHPHRKPFMLPQDITRLPRGKQIILRAGLEPVSSDQATWYTDKQFTAMVRPPVEVPLLDISVAMDDGH